MKNDAERIIAIFDQHPERLRGDIEETALEHYSDHIFKVLNTLGCKPDAHVLEIGCGDGAVAAEIKQRLPSLRFTLMDICPTLVKKAEHLNPDARVYLGNILDGMPDQTRYDHIISWSVAQYFSHSQIVDMQRILLPALAKGGSIVHFSIPDNRSRFAHTMLGRQTYLSKAKGLIKYGLEGMSKRYCDACIWHQQNRLINDIKLLGATSWGLPGDVSYRFHLVVIKGDSDSNNSLSTSA